MDIVLLFDVGRVVFVIRPAATVVDRYMTVMEIADQMMIQELAAIIGMKSRADAVRYR